LRNTFDGRERRSSDEPEIELTATTWAFWFGMPAITAQAGLYSKRSGCEQYVPQPLFYARALFLGASLFAGSDTKCGIG
jgi:hypothetical protein